MPIGTVIWSASSTAPSSYLLCNGSAVSRETYSRLFDAIGTAYGSGDGSTTFNLPNLIDKFIEGAVATDLGTVMAAGLPNITGQLSSQASWGNTAITQAANVTTNAFSNSGTKYTKHNVQSAGSGSQGNQDVYFSASRVNSIYGKSTTVQPPALKLMPCIKALTAVDFALLNAGVNQA